MAKTSAHIGNTRTYTVVFEPAEEGGYVVRIPFLNIATQGETPINLKGKVFVEHIDIIL